MKKCENREIYSEKKAAKTQTERKIENVKAH